MVSSSASVRLSCGSSRAAASAATTFLGWIAFWKIPYDRPCEVDAAPSSGPDGTSSVCGSELLSRERAAEHIPSAHPQPAQPTLRVRAGLLVPELGDRP